MDFQNLFNRDFYPTPHEVIEQMLSLSDIRGKIILEPSAGSGNIVNFLQKNGAKKVIACEINTKLQAIIAGKCELIASDFLTVTPDMISHIDMIVMNPPFSAEEAHILHAWEIAPEGCEIISLCNSSLLSRNYYERREKIRELIDNNGNSQCLGEVFKTAERQTSVDVSVIRLYKPRTGEHEFDDFFDMTEDDEPNTQGIVRYSYVQDIVSKYKDAVELFDTVMEGNKRMNELCNSMGVQPIVFGARKAAEESSYIKTTITRDVFKKTLQKSLWRHVFNQFGMEKYVTQNVINELNRAIELASDMPFTMKNIYRMAQMLVATHGNRMQQTLVETFEYICSLSAENSTAGEKWKTNSDYMINRRFIVPYLTSYDKYMTRTNCYVSLGYYREYTKIDDIVKALCYITGTNYDNISNISTFVRETRMNWGQWYEWGFFRIRGYKKGTMHFEFVDENVWYKFNQAVASVKGWQLPKQRTKP